MLHALDIRSHRNVGIIAHIDASKTTCTERILLFTGAIHRTGEVHHGDTEMDFMPQEREMGITISSAATCVSWVPRAGTREGQRHEIRLIDTPGHVDFTVEVERSLRVLDGAIALFDARNSVEPQSETVWRQAERYGVPRIAFVNKMDKVGASFAGAVASIRARLGAVALPVQLPLGEEAAHRGVIDLVRMRAISFDDPTGQTFVEAAIPEELLAAAEQARAELLEVGPAERGKGLVFEDRSRGGAIPREFVPAIEQGIRGALARGVVAGYPMIDVEALLVDGSFHEVDSRPAAFEVAASIAFRRAAEAAEPHVLEPIMRVEITAPEDFFGEVLADLHSRRGEVLDVAQRGPDRIVTALVPLRALFGHTGDLRSRTQGRASATMRLSHHARAPLAVETTLRSSLAH